MPASKYRTAPRGQLTVSPDLIVRYWNRINKFAMARSTADEPMDLFYEMKPGTLRFTGRMYFTHQGHAAMMSKYLRDLQSQPQRKKASPKAGL